MQEPNKLCMKTGEPIKDKVKRYPLPDIEQEIWHTIQEQKNDRKNNKESDKT